MDNIKLSGNISDLSEHLVEYMSRNDVEILIDYIDEYSFLLSDDEYFHSDYTTPSEKQLNHFDLTGGVGNSIYHLNIKKTTLALLCLALDIYLTRGFATFISTIVFGSPEVIKLDDKEKCFILRLKLNKNSISRDDELFNFQEKCLFRELRCKHRDEDDNCQLSENRTEEIVEDLLLKRVVHLSNDGIYYTKF